MLVLAHGGSPEWNRLVEETVAQAGLAAPTEIAFGMGMHAGEVAAVQRAVAQLESKGVSRIIAVPLLVSSNSEVMRQFEYLLGLRERGSWEKHAHPVALQVPVTMTQALDDDPVVTEILAERAQAISRHPGEETLVLVAHGPTSDEDNDRWLAAMRRVADGVKAQGGYRTVIAVTMRDDAPEPVVDQATRELRALVEAAGGEALVVPLLLARGGIESKIPKRLAGLTYRYRGETLLPHLKLSQWIATQVLAKSSL